MAKHGTDNDVKLRCRAFQETSTTDINIKDLKHEAKSDLWLLVDDEASLRHSKSLISVQRNHGNSSERINNRYTPNFLGLGGEEDDFEIESIRVKLILKRVYMTYNGHGHVSSDSPSPYICE
jgi:hypothetical protein